MNWVSANNCKLLCHVTDLPIDYLELWGPDIACWQNHLIIIINWCVPTHLRVIPYLRFEIKIIVIETLLLLLLI